MTTITAKDLTKEFPRSPYDQLEGISWLPRLIDKVRALKAGTLGDYTPYPCGGDRGFLGAAGLDADALKAQIDAGKSDEEIAAWVKGQLTPEAWEKVKGHRNYMINVPTSGEEMVGYLEEYKKEIAAAKPGVDLSKADNFAKAICAEEGYPVPTA